MCAETLEIMGIESGAIVGTDAAWEWRGHTGEVRCAACGRDTFPQGGRQGFRFRKAV